MRKRTSEFFSSASEKSGFSCGESQGIFSEYQLKSKNREIHHQKLGSASEPKNFCEH